MGSNLYCDAVKSNQTKATARLTVRQRAAERRINHQIWVLILGVRMRGEHQSACLLCVWFLYHSASFDPYALRQSALKASQRTLSAIKCIICIWASPDFIRLWFQIRSICLIVYAEKKSIQWNCSYRFSLFDPAIFLSSFAARPFLLALLPRS